MESLLNKILPWIIIVALSLIIFWPSKDIEPEIITNTVIKTDTVRDTIFVDKPVPDTVLVPGEKEVVEIWHEVMPDVDTNEIINRFFSKVVYRQVLVDDSLLYFAVEDTLFLNSIYSRKIDYKLLERTKTVSTTIIKKDPLSIYFGGVYNNFNGELFVGGAISKDRWLITADYGLKDNSFLIGVKYKFKLKRTW